MTFARYNGLLETHPLISKSLTAGLMNAFADLFCQVNMATSSIVIDVVIRWSQVGLQSHVARNSDSQIFDSVSITVFLCRFVGFH